MPWLSGFELYSRWVPLSGRHDLPTDARAFYSLASLEMYSSSLRLIKGYRLFNFSKVPPEFE